MKIKSNASPHEQTSPFYRNNKVFCEEFEQFVASKNGLVKGTLIQRVIAFLGRFERIIYGTYSINVPSTVVPTV